MRVFQTPVGQSQQGRSEHEDDKATEHEPSGLGTRPLPSSGRKPPQTQEENHCGHEKGQPITYPRTPIIVAPPRLDRSNPPYHRKVMPGLKLERARPRGKVVLPRPVPSQEIRYRSRRSRPPEQSSTRHSEPRLHSRRSRLRPSRRPVGSNFGEKQHHTNPHLPRFDQLSFLSEGLPASPASRRTPLPTHRSCDCEFPIAPEKTSAAFPLPKSPPAAL